MTQTRFIPKEQLEIRKLADISIRSKRFCAGVVVLGFCRSAGRNRSITELSGPAESKIGRQCARPFTHGGKEAFRGRRKRESLCIPRCRPGSRKPFSGGYGSRTFCAPDGWF